MLGTLIVAGVGALAFKLGMDAQRKSAEGKSAGQIAAEIPGEALGTVCGVGKEVCNAVSDWFGDGKKPEAASKTPAESPPESKT